MENENNTPSGESREEKLRRIKASLASQNSAVENSSESGGNLAVMTKTAEQTEKIPAPTEEKVPKKEKVRKKPETSEKHSKSHAKAKTANNSGDVALTTAVVVLTIIVICMGIYLTGFASYRGKFLPNTFVNGVDIAGMTLNEAEYAILADAPEDKITFIKNDGEEVVFTADKFGGESYLPANAFFDAESESPVLWFSKLFRPTEYETEILHKYSDEALRQSIADYEWGTTPPTDAKIVSNGDGTFSITPDTQGDMVNTGVLADYAVSKINSGENVMNMSEADCYNKPNVTSADLEETLKLYNKLSTISITFDMTNREEIFDNVGSVSADYKTFADWVILADDNTMAVDWSKAYTWVEENIAKPYDTDLFGQPRKFQSTLDGEIDLPVGDTSIYGWHTDVDATTTKLIDMIKKGESGTVEPVYSQEGFRMHSDSEGYNYTKKTYIEVSLTHQHLWYYLDGELIIESDVVTGMKNDPSRCTHPGTFYIWSKESPAVLGTVEVEGYSQPVSFWMPIDHIGIGLHDLGRYAYGGSIYEYDGSHGCVNLPWQVASDIYDRCVVGTPVIITP